MLVPVEASRRVQIMRVDTAGAVVLAPDASMSVGAQLATQPGTAAGGSPMRWNHGAAYLTAEAQTFASGALNGLGWRVVVRQPMAVVRATTIGAAQLFPVGSGVGLSAGRGPLPGW